MWPAGYVYGRRNGILCHARCNSIIDAGERGWSFPVPPQLGRRTDTFPNFHRRPQLATTFSRLSIPSPSRCHPVMSGVSDAGGEYSYELLLPPLQAGAEEEGASARPKVRRRRKGAKHFAIKVSEATSASSSPNCRKTGRNFSLIKRPSSSTVLALIVSSVAPSLSSVGVVTSSNVDRRYGRRGGAKHASLVRPGHGSRNGGGGGGGGGLVEREEEREERLGRLFRQRRSRCGKTNQR